MGCSSASIAIFAVVAVLAAPMEGPNPVPERLREELKLDRFYRKHADAVGLPVLGSEKVSDNALAEAAWIVGRMLDGRDGIVKAMRAARVRVVVMAADESTTDVPEHSRLKPKVYWDRRARGLGATPANPVVSCGEENLLGYDRDPYPNENIFVHEFAHAIHGTGLNAVDPTFDRRLRETYKSAKDRGLWRDTYAATNPSEYWAEGVQCWFDDNAPPDALHNDIRTRVRLKEYDPGLATLCEEVFGDRAWRYRRPSGRTPEDRAHLTGFDPANLPRFRWKEAPMVDRPQVTIQTAAGEFEVELDAVKAPEATRNFLRIALDGGYHSGRFDRIIGGDEAPGGWLVATADATWSERWGRELRLDEVPKAVSHPADGSIAMVPDGLGPGAFAVVVGEVPQTRAAVPFGRVVKGADIVRKILAEPVKGDARKTPVAILRVIRTE